MKFRDFGFSGRMGHCHVFWIDNIVTSNLHCIMCLCEYQMCYEEVVTVMQQFSDYNE